MQAAAQLIPETNPVSYGGPGPVLLPPTEKQMSYARKIASSRSLVLPWDVQQSRIALSRWIDRNLNASTKSNHSSDLPTSKQVAFAERVATIKRTRVPRECFKSRQLMSRWIDGNKPSSRQ